MSLPPDHQERMRVLEPEGCFHLEAPAGSGKTAVLLARFLTLLARIEDTPRELLALTFTRKAAGEFRERVSRYFCDQKRPDPNLPAHERQLFELAQEAFRHLERKNLVHLYLLVPERLPITTFHGFCAQLLRAAPHEAGVPLEFGILESEPEADWLKQEAIEALRRELGTRPATDPVRQALVNRLVRLNNNWPRLAGELRSLLARRDTLKDFLALAQQSHQEPFFATLMDQRLAQTLAAVLEPLAESFQETEIHRRWPEFRALAASASDPAADLPWPEEPPGSSFRDLALWHQLAKMLLTERGELRKRLPQPLRRGEWPEIFRHLPPVFLSHLHRSRNLPGEFKDTGEVRALQDLILLLHAAREEYEQLCRQRRVLDFIHLEEAALRLLDRESPGDLLKRLDWHLRHLLVDEFQDTSVNQTELLCRLITGWETGDGRTVMVVGDPRQSIYSWREARLDLFLKAREGLPCGREPRLPLTPLALRTNFRASRALIEWVNRIFGETVMADPRAAGGLSFQRAAADPGQEEGFWPVLGLFQGENRLEARQKEARWLARQILEELRQLPPGERLAVLLFARTHLPVYLRAMQEAGLVPNLQEGLGLTDSLVVQHLHNLARALVRPQDEVAWATLFRSPWARVDLATLAELAKTPGLIWPERVAAFGGNQGCPASLRQVLDALLQARERVGREKLAATVARFLKETQAWEGLARWEGALGVACARRYLRLLEEVEAGLPEATFIKADFALQETYQPPDPRAEESPVEMLTVHRAKGLEFHTVFVPYLDWSPLRRGGSPPPFLLEKIPGEEKHVPALAPPAWQSGEDAAYRLVRELHDARLLAEARRVFYVAVTRARRRLFLSGILDRRGERAAPARDSPLAWLFEHYRQERLPESGVDTWSEPPLRVVFGPKVELPPSAPAESRPLAEAPTVQPEQPAYRLAYPSEAAPMGEEDDTRALGEHLSPAENLKVRARGEITHRLLARLVKQKPLPSEAGVAAALMGLRVDRDSARSLAREILEEVEACRQDPALRRILAGERVHVEKLWEDQPAAGLIRRGRPDLVACDGEFWWLLDFKTSRPAGGELSETWLAAEQARYQPQLEAYREMAAKALGIPPESLRPALYFTAFRKLLEL